MHLRESYGAIIPTTRPRIVNARIYPYPLGSVK